MLREDDKGVIKMREKILRPIMIFLIRLLFGVRVRGMEHFHAAGDKLLIIANHQSFLDPMILAILLPGDVAFVMNVFQADKWYFRWVEKVVRIYRIDPSQAMSMKTLMTDMKKGAKVVLFPEGRITTSGGIMKIYEGASMLARKTGISVLPVHIDGAQYSLLSRLGGKAKRRLFPKIRVSLLPPIAPEQAANLTPDAIYDLMTHHAFVAQDRGRPLLSALLEAKKIHGGKKTIAVDITRQSLDYGSLFTRSFILSDKLGPYFKNQHYIAVLLPNSLAALVTFVSLQMLGKVPCMLNFSAGAANIMHACKLATARTILTSRAFVEKGKFEPLIAELAKECVVIYLEDVRKSISGFDKLRGAVRGLMPAFSLSHIIKKTKSYDPAVVLYTSGSEGVPKGVALSHANILANIHQSAARLDLLPSDKLFNALPVFHSFGLTIGMLMPAIKGLSTFLYPSPLHYRVIPELIYDTDSTIMVGTDTFYQGYARYAHPYDFRSIRLAVAGAEKLKDSTRQLYLDKYGVSIMQGYGVTETSPVISCNTHMYNKPSSVGRTFPGMETRLEPVEGIEQGGRLWIKGPNVMIGYIKSDQPGVIQAQGEWYDTGDIVDIDANGYITILGRAKRFAKIGGEMVSLTAVEEFVSRVAPDAIHAAVSVPDERKGEMVVLFTEHHAISRPELSHAAREQGFADIGLPRLIVPVAEIPKLGSGKVDYVMLKDMAARQKAEPE